MTIALSLLISAMQLLTMVAANPNLPPAFVAEVEVIANQAITVAKEEIAKAGSATTTPTPTIVNNYYTAPAPQVPMGAPVVEEPYPVEIWAPSDVWAYGGGCGAPSIEPIMIKYSDSKYRGQDSFTVHYPDGTSRSVVTSGSREPNESWQYRSASVAGFNTNETASTTKILLVKGSISKEIPVDVLPLVIEKDNPRLRLQTDGRDAGKYIDGRTGNTYNPDTYQCNY